MHAPQASCSYDQLTKQNVSHWKSLFGDTDPLIDSFWQQTPDQAAPTKVAAFDNSRAQPHRGPSVFSKDSSVDSPVLNNWQDNPLEPVPVSRQQQAEQLTSFLLENSTRADAPPGMEGHSNLLDSSSSDAAPVSPQISGTGTSQGAPASPSFGGEPHQAAHGLEVADDGDGGVAGSSSSRPALPHVVLKVACGDMIGTLLVHRAKIIIAEGIEDQKEVSPTEFERLGGRSATKKWKQSIRLVQDDGELGRPVGEWYVMQGLEQPKKARESMLNPPGTTPSMSPLPDRQHGNGQKIMQKRPVRAAARHAGVHIAAEIAGSPEAGIEESVQGHQRAATRKGVHSRAAASKAAAQAPAAPLLASHDDAGSGTHDTTQDHMGVTAATTTCSGPVPEYTMLPLHHLSMQSAGGMLAPAPSNIGAFDDASEALDAAALGNYQMPPGAAAAAAALPAADARGGPLLVPVPIAQPLPGDASQAVVDMTAYLEGRRSVPPWRLLPAAHRPLLGQFLVPLRQLFVLVMQAGGYGSIKDDLLIWQEIASQMCLPAWPCPSVPDPLRALQQVYRDYLLRFEGRFLLPDAAGTAVAGAHHSPTVSSATQYAGQQQQQQLLSAAADNGNFTSQEQSQMQDGLLLPNAAAVLQDTLSGDLLEFLNDLIPENDTVMPVATGAVGVMSRQLLPPGMSNAPAGAADLADSTRLGAESRQHPEMGIVQQRQRVQQLQQQMQQLRQQQQSQQQQRLATASVAADSGVARVKRPPPLIRCGDSDVVQLMDQTEFSQLLHDYEQHQQSHLAAFQRQQQLAPSMSQLPPSGRATSSQLAAAVAGAVDRNQSQDLQAVMQQYWGQQGPGQQQFHPPIQEQAVLGSDLEAQPPEEEMSGMLEALQLAADGTCMPPLNSEQQEQQPQHAGMLGSSSSLGCNLSGGQLLQASGGTGDTKDGGWGNDLMPLRANLLAQASVGAHLVSMMPGTGQGENSSTGGQLWQQPQGMPPAAHQLLSGSHFRQGSPSGTAVSGYQGMMQQQSNGDLSVSRGGLMQLTAPSSALTGSGLDSHIARSAGQAWMDISAQALPKTLSADLKNMTVELFGADGGQPGPSADDLASVLRMW